ncbi:putative quinol monooxygenase [Microbacterium sp. DT81.1]|uniref:putative quinol monooxygenase n=1 Tax=Microbacterium sp. DT81.1 TaxID=3393413 RepID=UPI003CF016B2
MDDERVVLYAEFTARSGEAEEVQRLLKAFTTAVRGEPGNLAFEPYRRVDDPDRFFVFEIYRDRAAFEAHLSADHGRPFNSALEPLIREDASQLSFLTPIPAAAKR